jgi:hypothetical protein
MSDIQRLIPKGVLGTTDTVIDELVEFRDDIKEIYVAVKYKDGNSRTLMAGHLGGLSFGILMLQQKALEAL